MIVLNKDSKLICCCCCFISILKDRWYIEVWNLQVAVILKQDGVSSWSVEFNEDNWLTWVVVVTM